MLMLIGLVTFFGGGAPVLVSQLVILDTDLSVCIYF